MGCGCGGSAAPTGAPAQYQLTYPDGRKQVYLDEAQARREAANVGGTVEVKNG